MTNLKRAGFMVSFLVVLAGGREAGAAPARPLALVPLAPVPLSASDAGASAAENAAAAGLAPPPVSGAKPSASPADPALQSEPGRVSEAREHFGRGIQAFKDGALEAALAEFLRAQELAPSYRLYFNIAQVHYELRNYVDAKRAFQRYLAGADDDLPSERRAMVEAELTKLDRLVAQFSVKTSVAGVQIAVDGVPAGQVSQNQLVLVHANPGVRRVTAAKMGFAPASMLVTVAPGERRKLVFELAPLGLAPAALSHSAMTPTMVVSLSPELSVYAAPSKPRTKLWIAVASAATLATATGVFALLARSANSDFEYQLTRVPNDPKTLDDARSKLARNALLADICAGATAVATGASLYFNFTEGRESSFAARPAVAGVRGKF